MGVLCHLLCYASPCVRCFRSRILVRPHDSCVVSLNQNTDEKLEFRVGSALLSIT